MISTANRNETYYSIIDKLPKKRKRVYDVIYKLGFLNLDAICQALQVNKNEISGRITELKESFLIKEVGSVKSTRSNNPTTVYSATTPDERINLVNETYVKLRSAKNNLINDYHTGLSSITREVLNREIQKLDNRIMNHVN